MIDKNCEDAIIGAFAGIFTKEENMLVQVAKDMGAVGKGNAALKDADYMDAVGTDAIIQQPSHVLAKAWDWMTNAGAPKSISAAILEPSAILPESFLSKPQQVLQSWVERYSQSTFQAQKRGYIQDVLPTFRALKAEVKNLPDHLQRYGNDYVNDYLGGGEFFDLVPQKGGDSAGLLKAVSKNVLKNSVALNPMIAALNTIEWMPKTLAEHGPVNTLKAIAQVVQNSGGKLWSEIPELKQLGIYGGGNSSLINPLEWTENFNKGIYYYSGAAKAKEGGLASVQKLGFKYRPGDAPAVFRSQHAASDLALMRYSIGQGRLLGGWAHDLSGQILAYREGKLSLGAPDFQKMATGAAALSTWLIAQSVLTGVKSTGVVLYDVLPEDYQKTLDSLEATLPINLVKKATGLDISQKSKPGGISLGVGQQIVNQDVTGAVAGFNKAAEGVKTGNLSDLGAGVIDMTVNSLMLAPTVKINGAMGKNIIEIGASNYKKLASVVKKAITHEINGANPAEVKDALAEKFVGKQEAN
jgi:hypothetical protein